MLIPLFLRTRLGCAFLAGVVLFAAMSPGLDAQTANPANDGFNPNPNGIVNTIVVQPDGKILIGGYFTQLQPDGSPAYGRNYIARLNHDGSVDTSFSTSANGVVRSIVLQPNGQMLVTGEFTTIQGTGSSTPTTCNYVARLNADGSLDPSFNPNPNAIVYAVAYQPNGQVIIGGAFTTVQPASSSTPVTRNHVARINTDGSIDNSFDPNTDRTVLALAVLPSGQIVVGGGFSKVQPNGAAFPTTRNCVARLNSDGSLDSSFDPNANGSVMTITVLPSNQIILGGQFTTLQPDGATGTTQCDYLARINTDGTLDTSFIINPLAYVSAVALQSDGSIIIGGIFTSIYAVNSAAASSISYAARISTDGSIDTTFYPNPNQAVSAIAIQPDGDVLLGGYFTSIQSTPRYCLARVQSDGSVDGTLAPDNQGAIFTSVQLSNGQWLVGGDFTSIGGITQSYLARVNADGSLDTTFAPTLNGSVNTIVVQTDGKYVLGGNFSEIDGIERNYMARMNPDGSLDGPYNPNPNGLINILVLQSSGKILAGGGFSTFTPNGATVSTGITSLARINTDGTIDTTFVPDPAGAVYAIATQADGNLVIAGEFTAIGSYNRGYIARISGTTGTLDTSYDPEANQPVYALALQSDGKIVMGGQFTAVEPQVLGTNGTPTVVTQPYQTITVPQPGTSATTPIYINHLARLNTDGTLDTTFFPDPSDLVLSLAIQSDGSILVGGAFTSFGQNNNPTGTICNRIGRIKTDGSLDTTFQPNANGTVDFLQLLSNGQVFIGGSFTSLQPNGASAPTPETHMAILNTDGSINTSFKGSGTVAANGQVTAATLQPNGIVLIGGSFAPFGGSPASFMAAFNADGSPTGFDAYVNGPVNSIAVLPNGALKGTSSNYAVWLESTGTVRYSFAASSNGQVLAVAQQANGQILVGGAFSGFAGATGTQYLVRLNTDGTVDTTFNPTLNGQVNAILVQPNGQIVIGGDFTDILASSAISYLARLNSDGSIDTSFQPAPNLSVTTLALQSDGKILVAGNFSSIETNETTTTTGRNYVARLNSDGTLDTTFNPDPNGVPTSFIVLSNGQILMGGDFSTVDPNFAGTTYTYGSLVRLNSDGTLDTTFDPNPNEAVNCLALLPDGSYLVGGAFTQFQPNEAKTTTTQTTYTTGYLAHINTDGSVDTSFEPMPSGQISTIQLLPNGQILVGGAFESFVPNGSTIPVERLFIARLNANGTVDPSFDTELNSGVNTILPLQDGSLFVGGAFTDVNVGGALFIGGSFTSVGGVSAPYLARLNADSTVDSTFTGGTDGPVNALTPQTDGSLIVGGSFAHSGTLARSNVVRLLPDGTVDPAFSPAANGTVNAVAFQPNNMVVLGGAFTNIAGQNASYLARVSLTGVPDASFTPAINGTVNTVAVQLNGQIVIGGSFTSVDGTPEGGIARLNSDGTLDATFNPNANGSVYAVSLLTDGSMIVAGSFTTIGGHALPYAAHVLSDGSIDTAFAPNPNGPVEMALAQADGKVLLGGGFTSLGTTPRYLLARMSVPTVVQQTLTCSADQSTLTWVRTGPGPSMSAVFFEESTDGTHWTEVGQGTPVNATTWQLTGVPSTGATTFLLRVTGVVPSAQFSSSGDIQQVEQINIQAIPTVTSAGQVSGGSGAAFSFAVTASPSPTFFWASGLPPGLSINSTSGLISGTPTGTGTYNVTLTVGNSSGSSTSSLVITIGAVGGTSYTPAPGSSSSRLLNLACRTSLSGTNSLSAGFVVSGTGTKAVLIRAIGPGLASFNVPGVMATPELQLFSNSGALVAQNTGWGGSSSLAATMAQVGAFPLSPTSADCAIVANLTPGAYTINVFDPSGNGGVVLAEIYDASTSPLTDTTRLVNLSAQGNVSAGAGTLIGGFVISGSATKSVIIRGIGPGLAQFGVSGVLPDPVLGVYDSNGDLVAENFSWSNQIIAGPYQAAVGPANIINLDAIVGAFAPSLGDTALVADLPPGAYTFEVTSASGTLGRALGEVYELP